MTIEIDTAFTSWVTYPGAPYTTKLVLDAIVAAFPNGSPILTPATFPDLADADSRLLQWCTYDALSHEQSLAYPITTLSSTYTIRKSLIRKHFLHESLRAYGTKHPDAYLNSERGLGSVPKGWTLDISWADELDEMWGDELWELAEEMDRVDVEDAKEKKWWILKPSMADRGMGIRLFESQDALRQIFDEFEGDSSDGSGDEEQEGDEEEGGNTTVITSQLRHFVIQEYLPSPLLLDPSEAHFSNASVQTPPNDPLQPRKFHLRAYCIAAGALTLYLNAEILALFAGASYTSPSRPADDDIDMAPHLTNTCLQAPTPENPDPNDSVRLLSELVDSHVLSLGEGGERLTKEDVDDITTQVADVLAEVFRAALESPVHFQPLPNAFELFGADLLVSHRPKPLKSSRFIVSILELNAEPAIEMTGARLGWVLEGMFRGVCEAVVRPFFAGHAGEEEKWNVGETKWGLRKCLDVKVRGSGGW